ncbi:MAG: methyltransferase domain-containing protein [Alicyclobacillus sp.]|nr:methyltransferase domain-containing protein [Alicyclobacillus sp.]
MRIPNFKSEEGSVLYKNTVGRVISPRVADVMLSHAISHLTSSTIRRVLDLGCGPGTLCVPIAAQYPRLLVTAVDSSDSMVVLGKEEAVRRGLNNIEFRIMNAGHIDLEPESFDLVLCNLAFPFFPRPFDSMCEVFGVVRPGGTVMFTVPGRHTWEEFFEVVRNVVGDVITMAKPFLSKFTQAEVLPDAMTAAGFEKLEEVRTRLPFHFENGKAVQRLFRTNGGLVSLC